MEAYRAQFIEFALDKGVLKIGGPFVLKSKRESPYFFNAGAFSDGESANKLGEFYARAILNAVGKDGFDVFFGPPYKGIPLVVMAAGAAERMPEFDNKRWAFYRKESKTHGEASGSSQTKEQLRKELVVGDLRDGDRAVILDDVITTGGAKYEAMDVLDKVSNDAKAVAIGIALDRQEVGEEGVSAARELTLSANIPVIPIITARDVVDYLSETGKLDETTRAAFMRYFHAWGTWDVQAVYGLLDSRFMPIERSVVPACDVPTIERFETIVKETADMGKIGGYKLGFELALTYGLPRLVEVAKKHAPDKPIIYDHQKAGTDIPDTGRAFAKTCKRAGVDAVILFPQAGPRTQLEWTGAAFEQGLQVIIGGEMTHPKYKLSDGGNIDDQAIERIYRDAAKRGVNHFVVPGNKPRMIKFYRDLIEAEGIKPVFFSPGLVAQGGDISESAEVAGERWHAIVGRGLYEAKDVRKAAEELTSKL